MTLRLLTFFAEIDQERHAYQGRAIATFDEE